jgi:phage replication O-like protein O
VANPQSENGHVDIAHEIIEALAKQVMSPDEWRILMVILRKTYGWHKKIDSISHSQFSDNTGISRNHIPRVLNKLVGRNIIYRVSPNQGVGVPQSGGTSPATYGFQKDFDRWGGCPPIRGMSPDQDKGVPQSGDGVFSLNEDKIGNFNRISKKQGVSPKQGHTKDNTIKENIQKKKATSLSDEEWYSSLKTNPAYQNIDIDRELAKMDAWLSTKPQKKKTKRFIVNWLNRVEKPFNQPPTDPYKGVERL